MKKLMITVLAMSLIFCSCGSKKKPSGEVPVLNDEPMMKFELTEAWRTDTLLRVPESVIYDKVNDVIYVSNMNNGPREKDGNGFISRLSTDGEILDLEWVGEMSSPKGLGIFEGKLYVSDVDEVIVIDISKADILDRIHIEGAMMINDISIDASGNLYVSDSDANCIYLISNGEVSVWLGEGLNAPNGLLLDGDRLLLASMGSKDLTSINLQSKEITLVTDSINKGDGIAKAGLPGHILVTDWFGEVFMIYPNGDKVSLLNTKDSETGTADIDFIPEKNLLVIPTFYKQFVVAYKLKVSD